MDKQREKIFLLVQVATVCVFAGRAYQHLFWDAPFRSLLWSEAWMSWLVEGLCGMTWSDYVRSPQTDTMVMQIQTVHGFVYAFCALIAVFIRKIPRLFHHFLWIGAILLSVLAFMYTKEKFFHVGQFLEYSLQIGSPLFLFAMVRNSLLPDRRFIFILKVAIAVTFVCHGLYAVNYYPRPGNFTQMCIAILGIEEESVYTFLNVAGFMDFALAIGIFLPRKAAISFLVYAVIWGFGTSIARVWANFYPEFWTDSLHQWAWESIMRFPHFIIPLAVLFFELKSFEQNEPSKIPVA